MRKYFLILVASVGFLNFSCNTYAQENSIQLKSVADSLYGEIQFEEAAKYYNRAANSELKKGEPDNAFAAVCKGTAASIAAYLGDALLSDSLFKESIELIRNLKPTDNLESYLVDLASVYYSIKSYDVKIPPTIKDKTETEEIYVRLSNVLFQNNDTVYVTVDAGLYEGLYMGAKGMALGVYTESIPGRDQYELGTAEITAVEANYSEVRVILNSLATAKDSIYYDDMIKIPARIPIRKYKSIFYELAMLNVILMNSSSDNYYDFRFLLDADSPELEKTILKLMVDDIKYSAVEWKDYLESDSTFVKPISSGKFKGMKVIEAMNASTEKDMMSFLLFVKSFPGKYMGDNWKINSTYVTWIINNTPLSRDEVELMLVSAKTDEEFEKIVQEYFQDIYDGKFDGDFCSLWHIEADELADDGRIEEAYQNYDLLEKINKIIKDENYVGWNQFLKAQILDEEKKYEDAIAAYEIAQKTLESAGNLKGASYCINNKARLYEINQNYSEALKGYEESYKVKYKLTEQDSSEYAYEAVGISLNGMANCLYNLSRYEEALNTYDLAIQFYDKAGSLKARKYKVDLYKSIGDIYDKQGDYKRAIEHYRKQQRAYQDLGDKEKEAGVLDNIAYILSKFGDAKEANQLYEEAYQIKIQLNKIDDAGFSKSNVGQTSWTLGEYDKAIEAHLLAIQLREQAGNKEGQGYSWSKLGSLYSESGDPNKSIEAYEKALAFYTEVGDKKLLAEVYSSLGDVYKNVKDFNKSIENYTKSSKLYEEIESRYDYANTLTSIGNVYYDDKRYSEAAESYNQSLQIQVEIGDKAGQLNNLINLGLVYQYEKFDHESAAKNYFEAIKLAEETGSKTQMALCEKILGQLYSTTGDNKKALEYLQKALADYRTLEDKSAEVDALINLGFYYAGQGEFERSEEQYNAALRIAVNSNNRLGMSNVYSGLGDLKVSLGDFKEALETIGKSYDLSKEVDNNWGVASALLSFGNIYNGMGEYQTAINYYLLSDSIYTKISNYAARANPLNNVGTIYFWQGNYSESMKYISQANDIIEKTTKEPIFLSLLHTNIGELYFEMKNIPEAEKWLTSSRKIAQKVNNKPRLASNDISYAKLEKGRGGFDKAIEYLNEALNLLSQTGEKEMIASANALLGEVYFLKKDYENAKKYLLQSITVSKQIGSSKHLWEPLFMLGQAYYEEGKVNESIDVLKEAITVVEQIKTKVTGGEEARKIFSSADKVLKLYEKIIQNLIEQNRIDEAFSYLALGNNESLREKFRMLDINFNDPKQKEAIEKEKEKKSKLDKAQEELSKEKAKPSELQNHNLITKLEQFKTVAEKNYIEFVTETVKQQPSLRNHFSNSVNPQKFLSQKRNIAPDLAVLLYLISDNNLYVFAATSDSVFAKVVDVKKEFIEDKIQQFYSMLKNPSFKVHTGSSQRGVIPEGEEEIMAEDENKFKELSNELYGYLLAGIEKEISGRKKIAVIPNGILYYLPFQVLGTFDDKGEFNYIANKYNIFYSSQLDFLTSTLSLADEDIKLLAVGNADSSLPFAEEEVDGLKIIYPDALIFVKDQATKNNVLESPTGFNILHFATHGILDYNNFENSYLVLAKDAVTGDDGRLKISDIWSLPSIYHFNLVTLSACETAVKFDLLEGWPITTASAFLDVGVPTVIASLWNVDDKATSILMKQFYENLKSMDKLDALQKAQMYVAGLEQYNHPYYWAPFLLAGSWR
ncbi:MAG: tetratricopeptide repeat protein [bacterium]